MSYYSQYSTLPSLAFVRTHTWNDLHFVYKLWEKLYSAVSGMLQPALCLCLESQLSIPWSQWTQVYYAYQVVMNSLLGSIPHSLWIPYCAVNIVVVGCWKAGECATSTAGLISSSCEQHPPQFPCQNRNPWFLLRGNGSLRRHLFGEEGWAVEWLSLCLSVCVYTCPLI